MNLKYDNYSPLIAFLIIVLFIATLPYGNDAVASIDRQSCNGVVLQKTTNGDKICVFEESVAKLVDRGYAGLGEAWAKVCNKFTQAIKTEGWTREESAYCKISTSPLGACRAPVSISSCLEIDIKPKTIQDCKDKYEFGYLTNLSIFPAEYTPISAYHLPDYASTFCDLDWNESKTIKDELDQQVQENGGDLPSIFETSFDENKISYDFWLFWYNDSHKIESKEIVKFWNNYRLCEMSVASYDGIELVFDKSHKDDLYEIQKKLVEVYPNATKIDLSILTENMPCGNYNEDDKK